MNERIRVLMKPTKTEANHAVASHAVRFAIRAGQLVTGLAIEEAAQQMSHSGPGTFGEAWAGAYNYRAAHRMACELLRDANRSDLIGTLKGKTMTDTGKPVPTCGATKMIGTESDGSFCPLPCEICGARADRRRHNSGCSKEGK